MATYITEQSIGADGLTPYITYESNIDSQIKGKDGTGRNYIYIIEKVLPR